MAKKSENQTSGKAEHIEAPAQGSSTEVKSEENAPKVEAESGNLADIKDISAEINAEIRKGAKKEAEVKKIDEENGRSFEDEITEVFETEKPVYSKYILIGGVIVAGVVGWFLLKNKKPVITEAKQEEQLNSGIDTTVKTDNFGMVIE